MQPAFPEVTTFGDTQPEAALEGLKAIEEAMAARISDGEDIPLPLDETSGVGRYVEVSALTFLKCGLYMICKSTDVSRAELTRRLGWHREQVDRLFRIDHKSQLDQIEQAYKALGVPLDVGFQLPAAA
ncbi:type II toxin-antitoxin system HicB family antitoxin [Rhizobium sp. T1470]|uniref:type II toxin-antitoxin system HicB family antitoxin n=1 Tax=unclassified Rhizobium TaxID=2613769 RepID=UPI001CD221FD|nr:type II toxin-antitoxin system HicB family antitoxin [Rhizobium sp. T1473]MCA0803077.1 type II toxin-antitoxin system HicB family antitoxin [Rhizobium sp. T1473]